MSLSHLSETLIGSEIVKLGGEIREKIRQGEKIYNFTVGDFDPSIFPIPKELEEEIIAAYKNHFTNYPAAEGNLDLRESVAEFIAKREKLQYSPNEILIAAGGRPLIYGVYRAVCDAGDKVIYAVPSWNNNHYTHFIGAEHVVIEASAENNFMPSAEDIRPHIKGATLISLCSPQNPTGTTMSERDLTAICDMVLEENASRAKDAKKLYLMYDQMYWHLTYGNIVHYNPVSLRPEMKQYTIFIDAISKAFAATGVRVGWAMGPERVISKMKAILTHIGAWAPMAEQKAVAVYLKKEKEIDAYLSHFKKEIEERLRSIYNGLVEMKKKGLEVDAIAPEGAIYLTIKFDLVGKKISGTVSPFEKGGSLAEGQTGDFLLKTQADVTSYLLDEAKLAIVPFYAFGASNNSAWYRLSVGTCKKEGIKEMLEKLETALSKIQ
jgi:aspartate aminotransferase